MHIGTPLAYYVVLIAFVSTLVRATFGFGNALVAMPLLAVTVGIRVATPLVALMAFTISLIILVKDWCNVDLGASWRLIFFSLLGIPFGLFLLKWPYYNKAVRLLNRPIRADRFFYCKPNKTLIDFIRRNSMGLEATTDNFGDLVIKSEVLTLVDFWGPKYVRCLELMPLWRNWRRKTKGRLSSLKLRPPRTGGCA